MARTSLFVVLLLACSCILAIGRQALDDLSSARLASRAEMEWSVRAGAPCNADGAGDGWPCNHSNCSGRTELSCPTVGECTWCDNPTHISQRCDFAEPHDSICQEDEHLGECGKTQNGVCEWSDSGGAEFCFCDSDPTLTDCHRYSNSVTGICES
jgi:hypothetical protein